MKKKTLCILLALVMVLTLVPAMGISAEETHVHNFDAATGLCQCGAANYGICFRVEDNTGKAYKAVFDSDSELDVTDEIQMPNGISYDAQRQVWVMNGFNFTTVANIAVVFEDNAVIELADGSKNTLLSGEDEYYSCGLDSFASLTVQGGNEGTGELSVTSGDTNQSSYAVCVDDTLSVKGGVLTAVSGNVNGESYWCMTVAVYAEDMVVDGGSVTAVSGQCNAQAVAVYCCDFTLNDGMVTMTADKESSTYAFGFYAYDAYFNGGKFLLTDGTALSPFCDYHLPEGYTKTEASQYMTYYNLLTKAGREYLSCDLNIDVHGFYQGNELQTTYEDQGYGLKTEGLGGAEVSSDAALVYGGHYVMLTYTVTADKEIKDGHLGIWTDVMIGDNDYAPVSVIKEEVGGKEKAVGFVLEDDHEKNGESCDSPNAKYMCYFGGFYVDNAAYGDYQPADTYWFGRYNFAEGHCFDLLSEETARVDGLYYDDEEYFLDYYNSDFTELTDMDSGMAVSWNVNQKAGETKTYYVLLGIGDATVTDPPAFEDGDDAPFIEDGKLTAKIKNNLSDPEKGGEIAVSVVTDENKEFTVGVAPLEGTENPLVASFDAVPINARPGNYTITKVRATNEGGLPSTYVFPTGEAPKTTVTLKPRTETLDLTEEEITPVLYEGWDFEGDENSANLDLFGLNLNIPQEGSKGIVLPEKASILVEKEGANINIDGEGAVAIEAAGDLKITTDAKNGEPLSVTAPTGIKAEGNLTLAGPVAIDASEMGIELEEGREITFLPGGSLEVTVAEGGKVFSDGIKLNIPEGYEILGGTVDEEGFFTADEGATTVIIRKANEGCPQDDTCVLAKFKDMDLKAWYHDGAHFCVENGYMVGIANDKFDPMGLTSRATIVTMLWRMEGCPKAENAASFKDVEKGRWYTEAVCWAQSEGIVKGYTKEAFGPYDNITREQLAVILMRYAEYSGTDVSEKADISGFKDASDVSEWAKDGVAWAVAAEIIKGRTDGETELLAPQGTAVRVESASMLQRFCEAE